jgi:secreted trypsin-like serine protease
MHRSKGPKSLLAAFAVVIALLMAMAAPASAITKGGVVDTGEQYPYVGLMVAYVEDEEGDLVPAWRCTGTLVSPELFVTAGHCTDGADWVEIWFDYDLTNAAAHNYPGGPGDAGGEPSTHPQYDENAFYLHDLGVVVLDEPYVTADGTYAQLPAQDDVGLLDSLRKGTVFTTVGYGLQESYPAGTPADEMLTRADRLRMIARPKLLQINNANVGDFALLLSNNSRTGGTCFGDSGGPTFYDGTLIAVTSYGLTETCAGVGGVYRIDTADDLDWLYEEFGEYM